MNSNKSMPIKEIKKKRVTLSEKIAKLNQSETEAAEVLANLMSSTNAYSITSKLPNDDEINSDDCSSDEIDSLHEDLLTDNCFRCSVCNIILEDQAQFDLHQKSLKHKLYEEMQKGTDFDMIKSEKASLSNLKMPVQCSQCYKLFWKKPLYAIHLRSHLEAYPYACVRCHEQFTNRKQLLRHLKKHLGINYIPCNYCSMKFPSKSKLETHMIAKHGQQDNRARKFKCTECDGKFMTKSAVNLHMRCHTGFRPLKCQICGKGFHNPVKLTEHTRVHSGEKPFQCPHCDHKTRTSLLLQRHIRSHKTDKPYKCSKCDFSCKFTTGLKRHMTQHTGAKPFKCPYCEYRCSNIANLRKHIKKVQKHKGLCVYACKLCAFASDDGTQYLIHMKQFHFPLLDVKLETAAKVAGIYVGGSANTQCDTEQTSQTDCKYVTTSPGSSWQPCATLDLINQSSIDLHGNCIQSHGEKGDIFLSSIAELPDANKTVQQPASTNLKESLSKSNKPFNASSYLPESTCSASLLDDTTMCMQTEVKTSDVHITNNELTSLVKLSNLQKILIPQSDVNSPLMLVVNSSISPAIVWD